jgi:hypothetical protein
MAYILATRFEGFVGINFSPQKRLLPSSTVPHIMAIGLLEASRVARYLATTGWQATILLCHEYEG